MIREIITYPNKLLETNQKMLQELNSELHTLLDDMYETMIAASGVGISSYSNSNSTKCLNYKSYK